MKKWRLVRLSVNDAFTNMAVDEAVTIARIEGSVPNTLRFYRWKPSAVSVGRFQDINKEVHMGNCRRNGVNIVRRISGGGTVYHDHDGEITYSVIAQEKAFESTDVVDIYNTISNGLIEAARTLGVNADFNPGDPRNCPNISVNGKKISGGAQFHKGGVLLQHGTFLLDIDLEKMFAFFRVPWAGTIQDVVCVARDKLTSVGEELNREVSVEEAYDALVLGFQKALEIELEEEPLTPEEQQLALKLRQERFSTDNWNLNGKASPTHEMKFTMSTNR